MNIHRTIFSSLCLVSLRYNSLLRRLAYLLISHDSKIPLFNNYCYPQKYHYALALFDEGRHSSSVVNGSLFHKEGPNNLFFLKSVDDINSMHRIVHDMRRFLWSIPFPLNCIRNSFVVLNQVIQFQNNCSQKQ